MGKYLIKSSESHYKRKLSDYKKSPNSILFGKENNIINNNNNNNNNNSDSIKFEKDLQSLRIIGEGGRWNYNKECIDTGARIKTAKISCCLSNRLFIRNYFIPVLIAMTLSCGITIASPTPSLNNDVKYIIENHGHHHRDNKLNVESFDTEYDFSNDYLKPASRDGQKPGNFDSEELDKLRKTIMEDIGLTRIPDPKKANVSQTEYEKAHREYLKRVELSKGQDQRTRRRLHVFHPADPVFDYNSSSINFADKKTPHSIYFPVDISPENHAVDHATLRILISHDNENENENDNDEETNYNHDNEDLEDFVEVSIYQRTRSSSRRLIANQRVSIGPSSSRWAEFDSTEAVASWLYDGEENLGFEMEIRRHGAPVRWNEPAPAALNVFTISEIRMGGAGRSRRATPDQLMSLHRGRRTECKGQNKKCCRHQMMVIFKDLKGFEFIIQPKDFDAGYCKGRCPPRYNPAHHHALLQSLIWKEDRKKAPRPCCAPSKLTELEILYFDENDSSKLKVSNWKNMKVLECACS